MICCIINLEKWYLQTLFNAFIYDYTLDNKSKSTKEMRIYFVTRNISGLNAPKIWESF